MASKVVGSKLTKQEFEKINKLVNKGEYLSVSDFVRSAVREKLGFSVNSENNFTLLRNDDEQRVIDFIKKHENALPLTIANELELDYKFVNSVLDSFKGEKKK